jgi:hypothetical protein
MRCNMVLTICVTVFLTISSVAWAICISSLYSPPKSALEICAQGWNDKTSVFCSDLARAGK